jgi:hypothetical protein
MKTIVTPRTNAAHILLAILYFVGSIILAALSTSCLPTRDRCNQLYPVQYKDTTIIKKDSVQVPFYVLLPGDTVYLTGKVDRPCPDSTAQWLRFTNQLNSILAQNKKYKQSIQFENDRINWIIKIKDDSLLIFKTLYTIERERNRTNIMPVVSYVNKVPTWCWFVIAYAALTLIFFIIKIFR